MDTEYMNHLTWDKVHTERNKQFMMVGDNGRKLVRGMKYLHFTIDLKYFYLFTYVCKSGKFSF